MVLLQGAGIGPAVKVLGELRCLRLAVTVFLAGLLLAVFAVTMPYMVGAMFLAMSGATLCMPLLNAITTHRTPEQYRGRMLGTTAAAASWGRVFGPLLAGMNLALFGYQAAWMGCVFIVCFYLAWAIHETNAGQPDDDDVQQTYDSRQQGQ
jgi:MFS family permease